MPREAMTWRSLRDALVAVAVLRVFVFTRAHGVALLGACVTVPAWATGGDGGVSVERGRLLLSRYHCGTCHTIPGVAEARATFAVPLDRFGRRSYIAGRVANRPDVLARWIIAPAALVPGTLMPAMGVSAADARDMAAYLGQLR